MKKIDAVLDIVLPLVILYFGYSQGGLYGNATAIFALVILVYELATFKR